MKTICVLFGGRSSEYDVSLSSAYAVLSNIDRAAYDLLCIGITREGRWYRFDGALEEIRSGHWCDHPETLPSVSLDLTDGKIRCQYPDGSVTETVCDVVFPVLRKPYRIQIFPAICRVMNCFNRAKQPLFLYFFTLRVRACKDVPVTTFVWN